MKKFILSAAILFGSFAQAQVISATGNEEPITEGSTFTFNTLDEEGATLDLVVTNLTDADIYVKLKVNTITNANGEDVQFCFGGLCYFSIDEGDTVPTNNTLAPIGPGETNVAQDHFFNENPGTTVGEDVIYNLSFIQVTSTGEETGTLLTFNYKYSPTASVANFTALQNLGITLNSTSVSNNLNLKANNAATLNLYSTTGQLVKTVTIAQGSQSIDVSALASGIYVAAFTMQDGKKGDIKIAKN
jgi:Secretion system C-terminal sorting domain